ncbi:hypothetical protein R3P38DRAFT_2811325 [Favolaschia claudopus]|uniref:Uncharacterized protein n=1 Tax=Favolaschia claudopus TaxID=2862362 RepID=A0AAV9Z9B7_9AGAR
MISNEHRRTEKQKLASSRNPSCARTPLSKSTAPHHTSIAYNCIASKTMTPTPTFGALECSSSPAQSPSPTSLPYPPRTLAYCAHQWQGSTSMSIRAARAAPPSLALPTLLSSRSSRSCTYSSSELTMTKRRNDHRRKSSASSRRTVILRIPSTRHTSPVPPCTHAPVLMSLRTPIAPLAYTGVFTQDHGMPVRKKRWCRGSATREGGKVTAASTKEAGTTSGMYSSACAMDFASTFPASFSIPHSSILLLLPSSSSAHATPALHHALTSSPSPPASAFPVHANGVGGTSIRKRHQKPISRSGAHPPRPPPHPLPPCASSSAPGNVATTPNLRISKVAACPQRRAAAGRGTRQRLRPKPVSPHSRNPPGMAKGADDDDGQHARGRTIFLSSKRGSYARRREDEEMRAGEAEAVRERAVRRAQGGDKGPPPSFPPPRPALLVHSYMAFSPVWPHPRPRCIPFPSPAQHPHLSDSDSACMVHAFIRLVTAVGVVVLSRRCAEDNVEVVDEAHGLSRKRGMGNEMLERMSKDKQRHSTSMDGRRTINESQAIFASGSWIAKMLGVSSSSHNSIFDVIIIPSTFACLPHSQRANPDPSHRAMRRHPQAASTVRDTRALDLRVAIEDPMVAIVRHKRASTGCTFDDCADTPGRSRPTSRFGLDTGGGREGCAEWVRGDEGERERERATTKAKIQAEAGREVVGVVQREPRWEQDRTSLASDAEARGVDCARLDEEDLANACLRVMRKPGRDAGWGPITLYFSSMNHSHAGDKAVGAVYNEGGGKRRSASGGERKNGERVSRRCRSSYMNRDYPDRSVEKEVYRALASVWFWNVAEKRVLETKLVRIISWRLTAEETQIQSFERIPPLESMTP